MFRVLLITKNRALTEFCRKNLPENFRLKVAGKPDLRHEIQHGIIVIDSAYLLSESDGIIQAAVTRNGSMDGAASLSLMMNEEHRAQAFSLFPENLQHIQSILPYRLQAGKVTGILPREWNWFLQTQALRLKQMEDSLVMQGENRILAERLSRFRHEGSTQIRFPAFMHGKSESILRFRERLFSAASTRPYLLFTSKEDIPFEELLEYYAALVRPENPPAYRFVDLAQTAMPVQTQAIWPERSRARASEKTANEILGIGNLHHLTWQNQTTLLGLLSAETEKSARGIRRYVFSSTDELAALVKKGKFRQDLYSLLRKASAALPALHERPTDISMIAAEYIARRGFHALQEQHAEIAARMLSSFDLSSGYAGLFMTLDLMNDLEQSKGMPVFELMGAAVESDAFIAARSFLREQVEPNPTTLFEGLAGGERDHLSLDLVERHYIAAVCARYGWQVTDAARHLGISRKTLYDKMRRYKLSRPDPLHGLKVKAS